MANKKNIYIKQIEKYLTFLNTLTTNEIYLLEKDEVQIRFELSYSEMIQKKGGESSTNTEELIDVDAVIKDLHTINNRNDGEQYLINHCASKFSLEMVLKRLDIPFQKKESISKLKNRIIEGTIGFRLRSQAIQGENKREES